MKTISLIRGRFRSLLKMIQEHLAHLASIVRSGYRSNAFSPLVWFNAVADPILLAFACKVTNPIVSYVLIGVVCAIVLYSAAMYLVIFLKDPRLLQTENFRLEDKKLDLVSAKGKEITIATVSLTPKPSELDRHE